MLNQACPECGEPQPVVRRPANWRQAIWGGWTCPSCYAELDRWGRKIGFGPGPRRTQTLDDSTFAANPGGLSLSLEKLRVLRPDLFTWGQRLRESLGLVVPQRTYIAEQLMHGDSRAAVVVSTAPLLVAAYTDEMDCIVILKFPDEFVTKYDLRDGTRLLTVNCYGRGPEYSEDLVLGPNHNAQWTSIHPMIAEFLSDDLGLIERGKKEISDDEWERAYRMGKSHLKHRPGVARDGRPVFSAAAAEMTRKT